MGEVRNTTDVFASRLAEFAMRWRWAVVGASLLVTFIAAMGMGNFTFATNYRVFFSEQNPELQQWERFQDTYTRNDNILVMIKPKDGNVFSPTVLGLIENYTDRAWTTPFILRVDTLANFQHTYAENDVYVEDGVEYTDTMLVVEDLYVNGAQATPEDQARIRDIAVNEPLLRNLLIAPDEQAIAMNIVLQYPDLALDEVPVTINFARRAMRDAMYADGAFDAVCAGAASVDQARCAIFRALADTDYIEEASEASPSGVVRRQATDADVIALLADQGLTVTADDLAAAREAAIVAAPFQLVLSGVSVLNNGFSEAGMNDSANMLPIMFAVVVALMLLTLRSFSGVGATLLIVVLSIPFALGVVGHIGGFATSSDWAFGLSYYLSNELTPIATAAPVVILTLAIADSIHILLTAQSSMRAGMAKRAAIVDAVRVNFLAVTITSLTTIIGFLALNFSDSPPYRHFGNISALGIFAAWAFSITVLPALMSVLPMKVVPRAENSGGDLPEVLMGRLADFVIRKHRVLLVTVGAASLALVAMIPRIELNDQWLEYFDESLEVRRDNDIATQHFGLYTLEYSFQAGEEGGINAPAFMQKVEDFAEFMRGQDGVTHVYSLTDIVKRLAKNLNDDDPAFYAIPDDRELAAQYLLMYEMSLPLGVDINDRKNVDNSSTRVTVTTTNMTTADTKALLGIAEDWIAANALEVMKTPQALRTQATGPQVLFTFVAERNVNSMIRGTIVAIIAIAVIMIFALRSLSLGVLSLVPNGLPILTAFGAWALLVGTVGFSVSIVAAVSLGIVVDDTVHFLSKYRRARAERGDSVEDAIRYAFRTVGLALVVNSVVLAVGFTVLMFSTFKPNVDMGLLTALSITFALVLDFLLLPALLLMFPGAGGSRLGAAGRLSVPSSA